MTPRERRQYDRQQREKETMDDDQRAERMMREAIAISKKRISASKVGDKPPSNSPSTSVVFERLRGLIRLEEGSGDCSTDYELSIRFGEFSLRPLKNQAARLSPDDLGFMVYGKNVKEAEYLLREILKTCRT
jgi:hypothetical protein